MSREPWSLNAALRQAVRDAAARMTDRGFPELAERVLADERARVAAGVQRIASRPWTDVFGVLRCPRCAGALNSNCKGITINPCRGHRSDFPLAA